MAQYIPSGAIDSWDFLLSYAVFSTADGGPSAISRSVLASVWRAATVGSAPAFHTILSAYAGRMPSTLWLQFGLRTSVMLRPAL